MQRGPSDSMSPCSHLGPKPRLGYTASLIERAVETRADAAGVVQTRSHHRGGHWELQSLCSAPFLYPFHLDVARSSSMRITYHRKHLETSRLSRPLNDVRLMTASACCCQRSRCPPRRRRSSRSRRFL